MVARTRDSSLAPASAQRRQGNPQAVASIFFGLLAVLAIPAGIYVSRVSVTVTLLESTSSAGLAILFGLFAIMLARRGRWLHARTLGRVGGTGAARVGRLLGWLGLCMGISAGLAVGFYGLLTVFAKS
jgi:hypothetical protein